VDHVSAGEIDVDRLPDGNMDLVRGNDVVRQRRFDVLHLSPPLMAKHTDIGRMITAHTAFE